MTSGEKLGAAGGKRTVYCGTPYKRPMSSTGRQLVEEIIMMIPKKRATAEFLAGFFSVESAFRTGGRVTTHRQT
ncbi:jg15272 [Pararge aegeria aegeria]|uniref:Jg15272 protein n=1 Tax=Pararge aegeria aegeria TaxID=348720 RepID=A0A8S4R413_9NEOP|nr:jg15272 [Pararge aegeria aegeria]